MAKIGHLDIYFAEDSSHLFEWLESLAKSGYNKNQVARNCLEIGKLFNGSITEAQAAKVALERERGNNDTGL